MKFLHNLFASAFARFGVIAACLCMSCALLLVNASFARAQDTMGGQGQRVDKRKLTTVQTASVDAGSTKNAVEIRYLNLPWGKATFGYIETGLDPRNNGYYSGRAWPIAHLHLNTTATYEGKTLQPGDYAMIITPKDAKNNVGMKLSVASFTPEEANGTFLVPGNVFVEVPKDAKVIAEKQITFASGAPVADHLEIMTDKQGNNVAIKFHYGDRTLTEKLMVK